MNNLKYWIKKYSSSIIIFLLIILFFKSCKSCSTERRYEYNLKHINEAYINTVDSLSVLVIKTSTDNKKLSDSINVLQYENSVLKSVITDIKEDKEYYRRQNKYYNCQIHLLICQKLCCRNRHFCSLQLHPSS